MAQVTHFFAGANSGDGFQNLFSEIVDLEDTYDLMVLKGGPGVGKATFMREIGRSMEEAGTPVEYLWCSGDPDSLDGVVLPEILPCVGFDQRNPHHCYDVWGHTARAVGAAPPTRVLRWTMLLHDLGKPKCFTQDANGIGHFYGHTVVSAEMAEEIMARLHFEHALAQGVRAQLACFDEMFPPERAAVHRMMARYGRETMWNLLQTKLADNAAKAPDGLEQAQKPWREALLLYNELLAENACCSLAELRIGGGELLAIGFSGRAVGRAKQRLLDEVASEKLANEHGALVRRAERLYRSGWRGETDGRE